MTRRTAFDEVYAIVRRIPRGRVMTYGQIVERLKTSVLSSRAVGWAMHACPSGVPWHRVVNARGRCSADRLHGTAEQQRLLEAEGVRFVDGVLDLERYRHRPRGARSGSERGGRPPPKKRGTRGAPERQEQ